MLRFFVAATLLSVSCAGVEGDTCGQPYEVRSFPFVQRVDLGAMQADVRFADANDPCVSGTQYGQDAVFAVELTAGQALTAAVSCSFPGAALYAVYECTAGLASAQCIDGAELDDSLLGTIRFWAEADDTYFLVVDYEGPPLPASGTHVCNLELSVE